MAGTIPLSMTQQFDVYGKPLAGGQLYIIQAGTVSTPQDAFQDTGLTIKQPYPMTLDAAGRVPQFFVADGSVKIRLQDKTGVVQLAADSVLVIGPSAGGGGGSTVDPTQLIQTGMMMFRHGVGAISGFVRLNNLTVGSATSGATERANQDCQALFLLLWPDLNLTVSGGRGASAAADWTANKTITTPDWRGYALSGLDDMGNAPSGRLTVAFFGNSPVVLGNPGGGESFTLASTHIPAVPFSGTTGAMNANASHSHSVGGTGNGSFVVAGGGGSQSGGGAFGIPNGSVSINATNTDHGHPFSGAISGGGQAHRTLGPRKVVTFYIKL